MITLIKTSVNYFFLLNLLFKQIFNFFCTKYSFKNQPLTNKTNRFSFRLADFDEHITQSPPPQPSLEESVFPSILKPSPPLSSTLPLPPAPTTTTTTTSRPARRKNSTTRHSLSLGGIRTQARDIPPLSCDREPEYLSLDSQLSLKKLNLFEDCFEKPPPANMTNEEKINYLELATVSVTERIRFMERKIMDFGNKLAKR